MRLVACVYKFVCDRATLHENGYSQRRETFGINGQWLWDHAIKFARWQHPAIEFGDLLCLEPLVSTVLSLALCGNQMLRWVNFMRILCQEPFSVLALLVVCQKEKVGGKNFPPVVFSYFKGPLRRLLNDLI